MFTALSRKGTLYHSTRHHLHLTINMLHGFYPLTWLKVTACFLSGEFSPTFLHAALISWTPDLVGRTNLQGAASN